MTADDVVGAVVVGDDRARVRRAVARLRARGTQEVHVAWTGTGPSPQAGREVFPLLGAAYAVNRLLPEVEAAQVVVVGPHGARATFPTARLLAAGGLDHGLPLPAALLDAALRVRGTDRRVRAVTGRLAARTEARPSSRAPLALLPPELGLRTAELVAELPSARAKDHLLYRAPGRGVVHLYADPSPRLRRGVVDRELVRAAAPGARVPALLAAVPGRDCLWVLEEEVVGEPLPADPAAWWQEVSGWLVELAGPPGPPLAADPVWQRTAAEALLTVPEHARPVAAAALERAGAWPSRHQHGDLQPKNVLLTEAGPAAVDWEGVWAHGLPGLDLLFLALLAQRGAPDLGVLTALVAGHDHPQRPVLPALARLGVAPQDVPDLVRACLVLWTAGEARRSARLGSPPPERASAAFRAQWDVVGDRGARP